MASPASDCSAEMAKTSGIVKNSTPVGKSSSSRDSHPDDLDTVLVVSSDEIKKAREAVDSVTSETATIDCHPVILDDSEEDTDRFVGNDASSSGLVPKNPLKVNPRSPDVHADEPLPDVGAPDPDAEREPETTTMAVAMPLPTMIDAEEEIEISASGFISEEIEGTPTREAVVDAIAAAKAEKADKAEPRATITEVREVEPVITTELEKGLAELIVKESRDAADAARTGTLDDETATEERPKVVKLPPRFDDETMPLPKADLAAVAGALETVPLNAAMVQNVIAQVDARAAARATGQPLPQFQIPTGPAQHVMPPPQATPRQPPPHGPPQGAPMHGQPMTPAPPARRLGIEIFITLLAFFAVAVPALYYLYFSYSQ